MKMGAEIKSKCEAAYKILQDLNMVSEAKNYNGATFAFNALDAALDNDIVMDIEIAKKIIDEKYFLLVPLNQMELCMLHLDK